MRARIPITALLALTLAGEAIAQTVNEPVEGTVSIDGVVARICQLGEPSQSAVDFGTLVETSGNRVGRLTAIPAQEITLPNSYCNFAGTTLTVSAAALQALDAETVPAGYSRAVNYTSTVSNWAEEDAIVTTMATAGGGSAQAQGTGGIQPEPKIADLTLSIDAFSVPSDLVLTTGGYSGNIVITLGPAVTE